MSQFNHSPYVSNFQTESKSCQSVQPNWPSGHASSITNSCSPCAKNGKTKKGRMPIRCATKMSVFNLSLHVIAAIFTPSKPLSSAVPRPSNLFFCQDSYCLTRILDIAGCPSDARRSWYCFAWDCLSGLEGSFRM